ncbi:S1-C subfamily serine protease [Clavibacter sp. B3I6]|uniref:MarP family serine protease n=1 Tax=Clavibacter sp. B3I6 TaxID=3042268 RepID=UPI0027895262|nr:MarP family serine protease [Clavibacter sp. B3I6]MDQ0743418.1 S1-C subfamily serine protease [Clavibacter sp. B3I6]
MSPAVDIVILVVAVLAAVAGWRRGAIVTIAGLAGIVLGVGLALAITPAFLALLDQFGVADGIQRTFAAAMLMLVTTSLVSGILAQVASLLTRLLRPRGAARGLDRGVGAVAGLAAWAVSVWFIGGFLGSSGVIAAVQVSSSSRIVQALDRVSPISSSTALSALDDALHDVGYPRVFANGEEAIADTAAPDGDVPEAVRRQAAGVVKVLSSAPACGTSSSGSGWVVQDGRIVTNAHVVAGSDELYVQQGGTGELLPAELVVFDPARDVAVLAVPDLTAAPLPLGSELAASDEAVVAGYPGGGPYQATGARIREVVAALGTDIQHEQPVTREVYSVRGTVRPGDSGGALFDPQGRVVGLVFATSSVDSQTGYAMTLDEIAPVLQEAGASAPVDSGRCGV